MIYIYLCYKYFLSYRNFNGRLVVNFSQVWDYLFGNCRTDNSSKSCDFYDDIGDKQRKRSVIQRLSYVDYFSGPKSTSSILVFCFDINSCIDRNYVQISHTN